MYLILMVLSQRLIALYFAIIMDKSSASKLSCPRPIPTNNKWAYSPVFKPVYETDKLQKEDLVNLCCHDVHCVWLQHSHFKEENELYTIFASHQGQSVNFMCKWLHFFLSQRYVNITLQKQDLCTWQQKD